MRNTALRTSLIVVVLGWGCMSPQLRRVHLWKVGACGVSGGIRFAVAVERIALNCTEQGNITLYYKEFVTRELRDCILTKTESGPGAWSPTAFLVSTAESESFLMKNGNKTLCSTKFWGLGSPCCCFFQPTDINCFISSCSNVPFGRDGLTNAKNLIQMWGYSICW